ECFGGNVEKAIESILETSKLGITVADLRANPEGLEIPGDKNPDNKHVLGKFRKDGQPGFNTPSGKIEFDSEILKSFGYDGPPIYEEPIHTPLNPSEEDKKYPLVLNSGSRLPYYTHSKLREIPWLNQFMPEPVVRLHPKDARERSINNGDSVRVFNHQNEIEMKAEVTNMVHAGMVDIFHGWHQANVNLLTTRDFDPITGFPPFRSGLCEVASTGKGRVVEQKKS
ncbi:MAG: molybdopterin dinucleotide binding domain-containing protein, partial [Gordonibacter sp.]